MTIDDSCLTAFRSATGLVFFWESRRIFPRESGRMRLRRAQGSTFQRIAPMSFLFAPILLGSQLVIAIALADSVPTVNIQNTCRAAASVTSGTSIQTDIDICVSSEQKAREQMVKDWSQYAGVDKTRCVQAGPKVYLPSYVEWLTCLEMESAVKRMRQEDKASPRR
jgi:hypothetical protein